jgi:hypothetical protein
MLVLTHLQSDQVSLGFSTVRKYRGCLALLRTSSQEAPNQHRRNYSGPSWYYCSLCLSLDIYMLVNNSSRQHKCGLCRECILVLNYNDHCRVWGYCGIHQCDDSICSGCMYNMSLHLRDDYWYSGIIRSQYRHVSRQHQSSQTCHNDISQLYCMWK